MAYLHGTFKDFADNTIEVQIRSKNTDYVEYEISDIDLADIHFAEEPVEISYSIDDLFTHVIKKSCTINLVTKIYLGNSFFATNEDSVSVKVYKNNNLIFCGFVEPYTYSQGYAHVYDEFTLNCIDYMSVLQYKYLTDNHTWAELIAMTDIYSFNTYLDWMGFREIGNIFYDMSKVKNENNTVSSILEHAGISMNVFLGDGEDKIMNFEEMLNEILKYLNLHMIQEGEDFYIFDWKTVENNKQNPWTCILKKKLYDDNMEEIENNTTPTSNIILSNKVIQKSDYSSSDTNLSMSEIYNQIKAKCTLQNVDEVVSSPTVRDDVLAYFNKRELFMTEFISYNEYSDAMAGARLKQMMLGPCASDPYSREISALETKTVVMGGFGGSLMPPRNNWELQDWYVQWLYNPNWSITYKNGDIQDLIDIAGEKRYNQQKIMKLLREKDSFPALVAISTVQERPGKDNQVQRYPAVLTEPNVYLVISANGREDDSEAGANAVNTRNKEAAGTTGLFTYNNSTAANYSPANDDEMNFLIFQGTIFLQPLVNVAGWEGYKLGYSGWQAAGATIDNDRTRQHSPNNTFGELRDKFNEYNGNWDKNVSRDELSKYYTLGVDLDGMEGKSQGGFYQRLFWKSEDGAEKEKPDPYSLYMYPPEDIDYYHAYNYNYTSEGNDKDEYKKFPVLECQLKIGEKYLVEITNGLLKENPRFGWYKLEDCPFLKDEDGNDTTTRKTTFTLGFDPEIGQPIIGKEYELTNTADGRTSGNEKGTAVPIKKSDALSGKLEFKILGIIGTQWDDITRRHPTLFRSTKWYHDMVNIMEHVSAIWIKDFKIVTKGSNDNSAIGVTKDKDILYVSDEERKYIKTKDDIEFKINTALSNEEAQELNIDNTVSTSYVTDLDTSLNLVGVSQYEDSSVNRPEKLYVDQYYNYYNLPKVILETDIWDTSTGSYNSLNTYQINGFGKMIATDITRDLRNNSVKVKMRQI